MKIAICIITYNRPEGLARLLNSLGAISFAKCEKPLLELIVVDNDVSGTAMQLCQEMRSGFKWPLNCFIEVKRGISYARNKAIESVSDDAGFVAFIDDDEVPEPYWLDELLYVQYKYNADVVTGPVLPYFTGDVSKWIQRGGFFERERHPTGHFISYARTGNVLIRSKIFNDLGRFDERFALTGGEDTHFFMRVHRAGFKIVWSDAAIVYEWVPESRMNAKWILQRAFRVGNTDGLCEIYLSSSLLVRIVWTARGFARISKGLLRIPAVFLFGRHQLVKSLRSIFHGAGTIAGIVGIKYEEYRNTHAD